MSRNFPIPPGLAELIQSEVSSALYAEIPGGVSVHQMINTPSYGLGVRTLVPSLHGSTYRVRKITLPVQTFRSSHFFPIPDHVSAGDVSLWLKGLSFVEPPKPKKVPLPHLIQAHLVMSGACDNGNDKVSGGDYPRVFGFRRMHKPLIPDRVRWTLKQSALRWLAQRVIQRMAEARWEKSCQYAWDRTRAQAEVLPGVRLAVHSERELCLTLSGKGVFHREKSTLYVSMGAHVSRFVWQCMLDS